jgi:hypothetical protein
MLGPLLLVNTPVNTHVIFYFKFISERLFSFDIYESSLLLGKQYIYRILIFYGFDSFSFIHNEHLNKFVVKWVSLTNIGRLFI